MPLLWANPIALALCLAAAPIGFDGLKQVIGLANCTLQFDRFRSSQWCNIIGVFSLMIFERTGQSAHR